MKTIIHASYKGSVLPHSLYRIGYQEISEIAFECQSKFTFRCRIEKILATLESCLFLNMGRVLLPNHDFTKLYIRYAHGVSQEKRFVSYDINQGISGLIYSSRQSIYADDLDTNSMYLGKICETIDLPYLNPAISGVPIFSSQNEIKGVLCVNHGYREDEELTEIENVLEHTAKLIAQLIKREKSEPSRFESLLEFEEAQIV